MKKNLMMRLASGLLVAVLLTTCAISGTFAKYVTSDYTNDSARVAKFGVVVAGVKGDANQMFSKEYADNDADYNGVSVASSVNVVAPGTTGTLSGFAVTGTPEVAVRVTYDNVEFEVGNNWIDRDDMTKFYCPIIITGVNSTGPFEICGLDFADADAFETAVENAVKDATKDYAPGTDLSQVNDDLQLTWTWDFVDRNGTENDQTDIKDTFLGDRAAGDVANAGTIAFSATCTVTQID